MSQEENEIDEETEEGARSFAHVVLTLCEGDLNTAASQELHDMLLHLRSEAVARNKTVKGEFTLKFVVEVTEDDVVGIAHSIKVKVPEPKRRTAHMWLSPGGNLTPENPRQQMLPGLREVPAGPKTAAREVAPARMTVKEV